MEKKIVTVTQKKPKQPAVTRVTKTEVGKPKRKRNRARRGGSLRSVHPYIKSLLNPDGERGASIPDAVSMASGTYAYVLDGSLTLDPSGRGILLCNPLAFLANAGQGNAGGVAITAANGFIRNQSVAGAGFGSVANPLVSEVVNPDISANADRLRIVSAEMQVWSAQAPVNIQGRVCSFLLPNEFDLGSGLAASNFPSISQFPNAVTTHLIEGGRSLYVPGGPEDFLYCACANDRQTAFGFSLTNGSYHSTAATIAASRSQGCPTLGIAVTGATASSDVIYRLVINIQYLPQSNNAFVNLEPVEPDPVAMSVANRLASIPRKLQGFYETHAEQIAGFVDVAYRAAGQALTGPVGRYVIQNAMTFASNALMGSRMAGPTGGQIRGSQLPRLL